MLEPLLMQPYYRFSSETPWGGDSLRIFGRELPDARTGESLEISALPGKSSVALNGRYAGMPLCELAADLGDRLTGQSGEFSLLLKLIDARDTLSVQVHPGDDYALPRYGKRGKTEAWLVLSAAEGSCIYCGLEPGSAPFADLSRDRDSLVASLRSVAVRPGDVVYIPHGLIHALGSGIMVYEIQQSSDLTFRIWDWGRVGADGQPRQLHMAEARDVVRQELRSDRLAGVAMPCEGGARTLYICDENFALWLLRVSGEMPLEEDRMQLVTALAPCAMAWESEKWELRAGQSVLVPAECGGVRLLGDAQVALSTLPDRDGLRAALGARAKEVAGLGGE